MVKTNSTPAAPRRLAPIAPEGRQHKKAKNRVLDMLGLHFRALNRPIYLVDELAVVYPGQEAFSPDVLIVMDVEEPEDDPRLAWIVADEGRGPDWVLEVVHAGDRKKDLVENAERYAALGFPEYFVYDRRQQRIHAYQLAGTGRYQPILPQAGLYHSNVLGLDLAIIDGSLRIFLGAAELYDTAQLIQRLQRMVGNLEVRLAEQESGLAELEAQIERVALSLRRAVAALLTTREIGTTEEGRARLDACSDPEILERWLTRATTVLTETEVFADDTTPRP